MNLDDQQSMPLNWAFGLDKNNARAGARAIGGGFPDSTHLQSRPPKPWPRSGQTGVPNQAPTMMASRLMQNTSTNDDIKYWMGDPDDPESKGATFDPPFQFPSYYSDYMRVSHDWMASPALPESYEYLFHMENLQELFGIKKNPSKIYKSLEKNREKYQEKAREALRKAIVHKNFKEKIMKKGELSPRRIEMIEKNEDMALNDLMKLKNETEKNIEFLTTHKDEFGRDVNFPSLVGFYGDMLNKVDQILFSIQQTTSLLEQMVLKELKNPPLITSAGRFISKGKSGRFNMYISPLGSPIGIVGSGNEYRAYNFEDQFWAEGTTPEEAATNAVTSEELDEVSSIGGGMVRGHIGPLGSDNKSPYLDGSDDDKKKSKKQYEPSMRAFGGATEVD